MDTIYLTIGQVEALYALVCDGKTLNGVQIESTAGAWTEARCVAVRDKSDVWDNEFVTIQSDGKNRGWER